MIDKLFNFFNLIFNLIIKSITEMNKKEKGKKEQVKEEKKKKVVENKKIDTKTDKVKDIAEEKNVKNDDVQNSEQDEKKENKIKEISFEEKYNRLNDKYLRLSAEFDNYRRRTLNERLELIKSAGKDILIDFLPIIDNLERAKKSVNESNNIDALKEGVELIFKHLTVFLKQKGIKEVEAVGEEFDTDLHEALTKIPVTDKKMKGKVVDVIEKGYKLNDKVIRFAKVVVGE